MTNIPNNQFMKISNVFALKISQANSSDTTERFLKAAFTLTEGEYLGLELEIQNGQDLSCKVFSSIGTEISEEDFRWIFKSETTTVQDESLAFGEYFRKEKYVYALCDKPSSGNCQERWSSDRFESLLKLMGEMKEVYIRVLACGSGDHNNAGLILISLPAKISVRMKAAVSMAFPDMVIHEVTFETSARDILLSSGHIGMSVERLLNTFMIAADKPIDLDYLIDADEVDVAEYKNGNKTNNKREIEDNTPIEDLELSVRAFNCLKRAGICTVGELRAMTDEDFMKVRNLGKKCMNEIKEILATVPLSTNEPELTAVNYQAMLDELIGLEEVKGQIRKIVAYAKMKQVMDKLGHSNAPLALNMEFVGNPGTAKTTVARTLAGILYEIGLLTTNDMVEVGRADLIAKYEGQTAEKVKNVFRCARGKLLFIDEAYSLVEQWEGSYGDEAINTIVQEMENHHDETIVVFAGYPKKMDAFFKRNPGLRSRVPFRINFSDYSVEEMLQIAKLEANKRGFSISVEAEKKLTAICKSVEHKHEMGNGRFCRNLVETAILSYASRVYGSAASITDHDFALTEADFEKGQFVKEEQKARTIGFCI